MNDQARGVISVNDNVKKHFSHSSSSSVCNMHASKSNSWYCYVKKEVAKKLSNDFVFNLM